MYYKLESTFYFTKLDKHKYPYRTKRTRTHYFDKFPKLIIEEDVNNKATVKVKQISENEYIKGTRNV